MRVLLLSIILPVLILSPPVLASTQDCQILLAQADSLAAAWQYDAAIQLATQALRLAEATSGNAATDTTVSRIAHRVGHFHYQKDDFARAEEFYRLALTIRVITLDPLHEDVAFAQLDLAKTLIKQGHADEARLLLERILTSQESRYGTRHPETARTLSWLAALHIYNQEFEQARSLLARVESIQEETLGAGHPELGITLREQGKVFLGLGDYDQAAAVSLRSVTILEASYPTGHPELMRSLSALAMVYHYQGQFSEAESWYRQALEMGQIVLGPDHPTQTYTMCKLGGLYLGSGNLREAESLLLEAVPSLETTLGPDHPRVAWGLQTLGEVYTYQNQMDKAESYLLRANAIHQQTRNESSRSILLYKLGNLYSFKGDYAAAEATHLEALRLQTEIYGGNSRWVAHSLISLAWLNLQLGRYDEAETLAESALAITEQLLGEEHPDVGYGLTCLTQVYQSQERLAEAEQTGLRALNIAENNFGRDNPNLVSPLNDLGTILSLQERYAEAEDRYREALHICQIEYSDVNPYTLSTLNNLGVNLTSQGRFAEADSLLTLAASEAEHALGPDHPSLATQLYALSLNERWMQHHDAALRAMQRSFDIRRKNFIVNSTVMSERNALAASQGMRDAANACLSLCTDLNFQTADVREFAAEIVFAVKGRVTESAFVRAAEMNMLSQLGSMADSLRQARTELSNLYVEGPGDDTQAYRRQLALVTRTIAELESGLARNNVSFRNLQVAANVQPEDITAALQTIPHRTSLVEYLLYDYTDANESTPHSRYLSLVMGPDDQLHLVDLGSAHVIDGLVEQYRQHMRDIINSGQPPGLAEQARYCEITSEIFTTILGPLADFIADSELLFIAPDGALNLVSFATLCHEVDHYLIENHIIHYLSSGRDLVRLKETGRFATGLFALGDPDYDASDSPAGSGSEPSSTKEGNRFRSAEPRNAQPACDELTEMTVNSLPSTKTEIENIAEIWRVAQDTKVSVYLGKQANENMVKSQSPGNRVIYLATHGFYLDNVCSPGESDIPSSLVQNDFIGENPLLLSGLFLAGANMRGAHRDGWGLEDGILTAAEVTAMNLSGTQVVVLSACESGLGEVRTGEGVYGLRRAFMMAGARTVISMLWPVPDQATSDLMGQLYGSRNETVPESLRRVQLERIELNRSLGWSTHPFSWGAVVATGDWR